jgi:hypothetical protein
MRWSKGPRRKGRHLQNLVGELVDLRDYYSDDLASEESWLADVLDDTWNALERRRERLEQAAHDRQAAKIMARLDKLRATWNLVRTEMARHSDDEEIKRDPLGCADPEFVAKARYEVFMIYAAEKTRPWYGASAFVLTAFAVLYTVKERGGLLDVSYKAILGIGALGIAVLALTTVWLGKERAELARQRKEGCTFGER